MENVDKKWTRSKDGMLGGVLGGLAKYLDADPTIIRLIFILFWLGGFSLTIAYLIIWVFLPEEK